MYTLVRRRPFTPPQLAGFTCAALALFVAVVCGARLLGATAANEDIASATAPATLSLRAPTSAQASAASARLGLEQAVYHVDDLDAVNPAEGLSTRFGRGAVTVSTGKAQLRLSVSSFGHPGAMRALAAVAPRAGIAGATYPHPDLVESYANGPLGLEQSFVVATRPAGSPGSLTVSIATAGSFQARLAGTRVVFSDGRSQLTYGGLSAVDASGRTLASHLALRHGALAIVVDDRGARYPIRIDPYVQGATLFGLGESGRGFFGQSGAISADGSTIMIGAPQDGTAGAAYVYVYAAATGWTQQTELILTKPASAAFGSSVALSSNGDVALIGSPNEGRVYVWARSGTIWTNVAIIAPSVSVTGFGVSVALSANGAIGLIGDNGTTVGTNLSSAFFYDHPDGISYWVGGAPVTPAGEDSNGSTFYPMQVALSSSGATALLGNAGDDGGLGSAWPYAQSGATWVQQGGRLSGSDETGNGGFGGGVALSGDGMTAAIGAPDDACYDGAGYVFVLSGSTWTQQSSKLTNSGIAGTCSGSSAGGATFGEGAALSADGNTLLFGGGDPAAFMRSGSTWTLYQGTGIDGGGVAGLTSNGSLALTSCPGCGAGVGQAYVNRVQRPIRYVLESLKFAANVVTPAAGLKVRFKATKGGAVIFQFKRLSALVGGQQVTQLVATQTLTAVKGANSHTFKRLNGHRLAVGAYRLSVQNVIAGKRSPAQFLEFDVTP